MAGLFLDGPFFVSASGELIAVDAEKQFFKASGSAAKANAEIGIEIGRKVEFEFPFKPLAGIAHEESLAGLDFVRSKKPAAHTKTERTIWTCRGERS